MPKKNKLSPKISPETKNSVMAVLLIGLAVILILAIFDKAGPVGRLAYFVLKNFLGWGYYLLPAVAVLIALLFLFSRQRVGVGTSLIGAFLFVVSGLGFIDIVFENKGGLLGNAVGFLEIPFGYAASIIISALAALAALLLAFNASIKFSAKDEKGVDEEKAGFSELEEVIVAQPETPKPAKSAAAKTEKIAGVSAEDTAAAIASPAVASKPKLINSSTQQLKIKSVNYVAPPPELLKSSAEKPSAGDLRANANIIKRTLESFGIPVEMGEINIGPKVTRYTLKPAEGVKLSRITALNQDLSLALAAHPIRIEAPIPGKSLVGIEVPNKSAAIVRLGSLMAYPEFKESGPLTFILGRGISGEPIMADIDKMPHLLIAGSTGSGKSVSIHAMIVSLLYKNSPATLRLALIDPKRVELSVYRNLPHLIAPVITDGKKTIGLFRWAIQEMERRYEVLLEAGARDIGSYNQKNGGSPLPYLLIVIDELADLMAAYGKEIEGSVVRLAQMARATGIHLAVSTQRPSVEVITGLIKANITARAALQVASQVDSRTILDTAGAEKLLGGGDMLFVSSEFSKPKRIQGAYISEEEIQKVAKFVSDNNEPIDAYDYLPESARLEGGALAPEEFLENDEWQKDDDELVDQAIEVVREARKASASLLQRRLKVGYARAARLLDIMEEKKLIGPGEGAKPREVFINKEGGDIN